MRKTHDSLVVVTGFGNSMTQTRRIARTISHYTGEQCTGVTSVDAGAHPDYFADLIDGNYVLGYSLGCLRVARSEGTPECFQAFMPPSETSKKKLVAGVPHIMSNLTRDFIHHPSAKSLESNVRHGVYVLGEVALHVSPHYSAIDEVASFNPASEFHALTQRGVQVDMVMAAHDELFRYDLNALSELQRSEAAFRAQYIDARHPDFVTNTTGVLEKSGLAKGAVIARQSLLRYLEPDAHQTLVG